MDFAVGIYEIHLVLTYPRSICNICIYVHAHAKTMSLLGVPSYATQNAYNLTHHLFSDLTHF